MIHRKYYDICLPGEIPPNRMVRAIDDPELTATHKNIVVGQKLCLISPEFISREDNTVPIIPVECIFAEKDMSGTVYYYFKSVDVPTFNNLSDPRIPEKFWKILESTSPYIRV